MFLSTNRQKFIFVEELTYDSYVSVWQSVFDIPDLYYNHVSQHADLYPSGNKPDGGCACLWEGLGFYVNVHISFLQLIFR